MPSDAAFFDSKNQPLLDNTSSSSRIPLFVKSFSKFAPTASFCVGYVSSSFVYVYNYIVKCSVDVCPYNVLRRLLRLLTVLVKLVT